MKTVVVLILLRVLLKMLQNLYMAAHI